MAERAKSSLWKYSIIEISSKTIRLKGLKTVARASSELYYVASDRKKPMISYLESSVILTQATAHAKLETRA